MERLLGFDAQLLFDSAIAALNVGLLFAVLSYRFFNPVRDYLRRRRERIMTQLRDSEEAKNEALAMKEEYEMKLGGIYLEAEAILKDTSDKARKQADAITRKAREDADAILNRARRDISLEREKAREEMRSELVSVAAAMAMRVISGMMDGRAQKEMIEKISAQIGEKTWQA